MKTTKTNESQPPPHADGPGCSAGCEDGYVWDGGVAFDGSPTETKCLACNGRGQDGDE